MDAPEQVTHFPLISTAIAKRRWINDLDEHRVGFPIIAAVKNTIAR